MQTKQQKIKENYYIAAIGLLLLIISVYYQTGGLMIFLGLCLLIGGILNARAINKKTN